MPDITRPLGAAIDPPYLAMRGLKILIAIVALLTVAWFGSRTSRDSPASALAPAGDDTSLASPQGDPDHSTGDALESAFLALADATDASKVRSDLKSLRTALDELPREEAVELIRGFLGHGDDRSTGLEFEIGRDGSVVGWPSFRTFLLDALYSIDPAAAAAVGREVLATATTADEWALCLRNVARGESPEDAGFLRAKTEELITHPAWQADPSIGYLNAFDVLVEIEATESTPLISRLIQRKDRRDLAHAGFLTLDRLVQRQPVDVLSRLSSDRNLQESRPEMVAQQFARADLRDPAQQALVKEWLLDPARTPTELRAFSGVYPNNNRFVSNNLLTTESALPGDELAAHDRDALRVISGWTDDPAFLPVRDHLLAMVSRLDGFVGTRDGNSPPND
ncbi:hypothetical protein [Luteolibacter marinus]|uniref:hypothetical protein n=1 Tax=Luteolibacter marinus TaxID=2776705 RepID=UPI001865A69F|nr:hypothetical protein [Luteolibacter marinus]